VITAGEVPGTVTVTAAIKDDPLERTVSVKVKIITRQTDLLRLRPDAQEPGQILWLDAQGNVTNPEDSLTGRVILRHDAVSTGTYTFTISPEAFDNAGNNLPLTAGSLKWASSDTKIAGITSVAADGTATVTVRSGSVGSCVITAVTTDAAKIETAVTIHVRDYSPRLESASLTANALTCAPVTTGLVESYGNTIQAVTLYEYDAQEKAYSTEPSRRLKATWDANVLSITPAETIANGTVKLLLEVGCGDGLKYQFPISLKVKNTTPSITAKQTGKLNLFYGDSEATFTVSVKDSTVLGVTVDETSTDSFQVNGFDPATGTVTLGFTKDYRSGGKPDTSIQLLLTLEGYNQPVGKKVTISTTTVRPKLAVTPSASVINTALSGDPTTLIRVYDKTTGENLALTDGDVEITATFATSVVVDGGVQLTLDAGKGGTATILVQQDNWREAVKLTHKISVQTKLPTPKPAATTLKLNSVFSWQTAQTVLTLDQANLTIASVDFEPTVEAGAMIDLTYEDGIITAEFVDTDALPKAGTYTYRYTVKLADGTELAAKTLKVTVAATVPKVKLASTTLKLNRFLTGEETAQTTVSVGTAGYTLAGFAELDDWSDENVKLLFDPDTGALCAELLNPDAANKKHTFQLTPILLHEATGQQAPLPAKVKLGVQIYNNTSLSVSLSTKGKLDLMDPDSRITYTVSSISNAAGRIEDVTLTGDDADLFDITCDLDAAKPVIQLKMVDGAEYATNVTYKVQLSFLLCGQDVQSKILSIRVSQSKLKLAANPKTWLYYQSQTTPLAGAVTLTAPEGAMLTEEGITLNRSKTTAALLEALGDNDISVKISEDGKTAHISGVIVDAGHLIAGKSYSLYLDILPLNNAVNTKATTLKVTVKVQK